MKFPHLFSPIDIGTVRLKNRIVMAPMETHLGHADGSVSREMIAYYRERALGGASMIIVEYTCVDGTDGFSSWSPQLRLDGTAYRAGHAKLTHAIRLAGAKTCIELSHAGRQTREDVIGRQPVSPSAVPLRARQFVTHPRALTEQEIERIIQRFATAASYAVAAGYDAVMLHGAHGYLLHQFLSPRVNRRDDAWGGDLERRSRFAIEVIRAVRQAIGDRPLLYRMSVADYLEDGLTIEDSECIAPLLRDAGVDAFDISHGSLEAVDVIVEPMDVPEGARLSLARRIRSAAGKPVICAGVMRSPEKADAAIAEGLTDVVSLGRALLADPFWPAKARAGASADIRPCTSCNWCVKEALSNRSIGCAENPRCGHETDSPIARFGEGREAIVVGAGPGGMAAALMLDQAGFSVELIEQRASLGGNLIASATPPGKEKLFWYRDFLVRRLEKTRITVRLNTKADAAMVVARRPDAVIIACGAQLAPIELVRGGSLPVDAAYRVLLGDVDLPRGTAGLPVIIHGGGETGAETAEFLSSKGHHVALVTRSGRESIARNADRSYRLHLLERLYRNPLVRIVDHTQVLGYGNAEITITTNAEGFSTLPACALLLAHGLRPDRTLTSALVDTGLPVISIGDAHSVARIGEAVRDAYQAVHHLRRIMDNEEMLAC